MTSDLISDLTLDLDFGLTLDLDFGLTILQMMAWKLVCDCIGIINAGAQTYEKVLD